MKSHVRLLRLGFGTATIQSIRRLKSTLRRLSVSAERAVQPELFGADQGRQFSGTMQQADEQKTVGARVVKHDVVPKLGNTPAPNFGNAGKSGQSTRLGIP